MGKGRSCVQDLIDKLELVACDAARLIEGLRAGGVSVAAKADGSPVTEADARSETLIRERLASLWPEIPVVAEELMAFGAGPTSVGGRYFVVDPLDGTKEFIGGRREYTVNIALIDEGEPVAGVVVAPALGEVYCGSPGIAYRGRLGQAGGALERRQIKVRKPGRRWKALTSRSHMTEATRSFLQTLPIEETLALGSSVKFCMLAAGEADIYPRIGQTMQWDTAAGDAVLRAAGGIVVTLDGEPLRYGPRGHVAASRFANPPFVALAGDAERFKSLIKQ